MDFEKVSNSVVTGGLAFVLVTGAVYESVSKGSIEAGLLGLATAAVAVYFTGRANKQVNGEKVDALTQAVAGIHARLDESKIKPSSSTATAAAIVDPAG